jgi:hypothetical protein
MKTVNSVLTDKIFSHLDTTQGILRLLRSLGYDLQKSPTPDDMFRDPPVTVWSTTEQNGLPCLFLEMPSVTGESLYPIVSELVRQSSLNLVLATADYRYLFIAAIQQTHPPSPASETGGKCVLPSTVIRRLDTKHLTGHDRLFLEELTRTCESHHAQFVKILYAFNRIDQDTSSGISDGKSAWSEEAGNSLKDTYHHLRRSLQPFRDIAYSGSQSEKFSRLILPVLNILEYTPVPVNTAPITGDASSTFLLFEQHSETPGTQPVAFCHHTDSLSNPCFFDGNAGYAARLLAAQRYFGDIINTSGIRNIIVTDGRIWAVYHLRHPEPDPEWVDLYRLLKLDYGRSLFPDETFLLFMDHFSCYPPSLSVRPASTAGHNRAITAAAEKSAELLVNAAVDLFKPHIHDAKNLAENARLLLYEFFHILYCELTGLVTPTDAHRWNIPDLYRIALFADSHPPEKTAVWIKSHLATSHDLDVARNHASGLFAEPGADFRNTINLLDARCLHDCAKLAGNLWVQCFGDGLHLFRDMAEDFCRFLESIFSSGSVTELSSTKESDLQTDLSIRFGRDTKPCDHFSDQGTLTAGRPSGNDAGCFFHYHIVDPDPGAGLRLVQALKRIETTLRNRILCETGHCFTDYLQGIRARLMVDSHEQRLFLDHRILTDARLLRLLCIQQCLYGLTGLDIACTAPANLFLSTGLNGIRFPHIGHHFQQDVEYTVDRLSLRYEGLLPGHMQAVTGSLAGIVTAGRWIAAADRDFQTCGPDFQFMRRQYRLLRSRIHHTVQTPEAGGLTPVELVFPWLFYSRLSGETGAGRSGNGFDTVLV